jgi:neurotransmitter:Na+ symporter, NSS family
MKEKQQARGTWTSTFGFLMAAIGSAVGLGNMWGFPYKLGMNGGFAFLLLYLLLVLFAGYILTMTELALGRYTGQSVILAYKSISKKYTIIGWLGMLSPFLILGFYSYLGGYCIKYMIANLGDIFGASWGVGGADSTTYFSNLTADIPQSVAYTLIFLVITIIIVSFGIEAGIEKFSKVAMPALFFMLLIVIIRSVTLPGAFEGIEFLFKPNFEVFKGTGWISVLSSAGGQMFLSLSIGMGITVTYGSHLPKDANIEQSSIIIPLADTIIAVMASLAIMPAVFASGQSPQGGVGLLYMTLQTVFNGMGKLGPFIGTIFYGLVVIAALTSSVAILEAIAGSFIDDAMNKGKGDKRKFYCWAFGIATGVLGVLVAYDGLGQNLPAMFGKFCWVDGFDLLAEGIMMPLGSLIATIFFGWIDREILPAEVHHGSSFRTEKFYRFCIRWVAPVFTFFVLLGQLDSFLGFGWFS